MAWELEFCYKKDDFTWDAWQKAGFQTICGLVPYRFECRDDAERELFRLHPTALRRVVPAKSVVKQDLEH
jgi:hypothetical protein